VGKLVFFLIVKKLESIGLFFNFPMMFFYYEGKGKGSKKRYEHIGTLKENKKENIIERKK
jgi:hypothetical protein